MAIPFYKPRARFLDDNGDPLSLGRVSFYEAGTTTLKTVYSGADGITPISNPQVLDVAGYVQDGGVWFGPGTYKITVEASDGGGGYVERWTMDDLPGDGTGDALSLLVVDTVEALRGLTPGVAGVIEVLGYYDNDDGGGGLFRWDASATESDNGGTIISPTGAPASGRWLRVLNNSTILPQYFGAMSGPEFSISSNLLSMIDWCQDNPQYSSIYIPVGDYYLNGDVTFDGALNLEVAAGVLFKEVGTAILTLNCSYMEIHNNTPLVDVNGVQLFYYPIDKSFARLDWWGITGGINDTLAVNTALASVNANTVFELIRQYTLTNVLFDDHHLYFRTGSAIIFTSTQTKNIGEFETDPLSGPIFKGVLENLFINKKKEVKMQWFDIESGGEVDNNQYNDLIESLTVLGNVNTKILWDRNDLYTFADPYINPSARLVSHEIIPGTKLKFNASFQFGVILNGPGRIFETSGLSYPILYNNEILPQWWGANDGNKNIFYAANKIAIEKAAAVLISLEQEADDDSHYINGLGASFFIEETIELFGNAARTLRLKNFTLAPNALSGDRLMSTTENVEFENVSFDTLLEPLFCLSVDSDESLNIFARFINCKFKSQREAIRHVERTNDIDNLFVSHCRIDSVRGVRVDCNRCTFFGNEFLNAENNWYFIECDSGDSFNISNNTFLRPALSGSPFINVRGGKSGIMNGNYISKTRLVIDNSEQSNIGNNIFDECELQVYNPHNVIINANHFVSDSNSIGSQLRITGTGNPVIDGLIVTGNIWQSAALSPFDGITISGIASSGHRARVVNNSSGSNNVTLLTTETKGFVDVAFIAGLALPSDFTKTFNLPSDDVILRFGNQPIRAELMPGNYLTGTDGIVQWSMHLLGAGTDVLPSVTIVGGATGTSGTQRLYYKITTSDIEGI